MKSKKVIPLLALLSVVFLGIVLVVNKTKVVSQPETLAAQSKSAKKQNKSYWFLLHRKSNKEYLYQGVPGDKQNSVLLHTFIVKTGRPGERPTPLHDLMGKDYWLITGKRKATSDESAPYFLTLNIPFTATAPYGPDPYNECDGQCNWILPGEFGLHGINGKEERLSKKDPGSSGCIRHSDEDITYLYNLLDPMNEEIRYYIKDI